MRDLFAVALACFALGGLIDVIAGTRTTVVRSWPYVLGLAGSACLVVLGVHATTSSTTTLNVSRLLAAGPSTLYVDRLAGFFLTLLFGIGVAVSACFVSWASVARGPLHRGTASGYLLLLGAVALIVCASDAFLFLFAWELLTLAFYVLTSITRSGARQTSAAWSTVGMGKVSGAALLFGFLLLAGHTSSLVMAHWHAVGPGATLDVAWVLIVVGFAAKLGVVPFQVWIPLAYPAAPGPARAAMSSIGATVGVYGLWRFMGILHTPPVWLVIVVLLSGGVTALLGITFAGVQTNLTRVVAYSSIENAGLIITGYGIALTGVVLRSPAFVAVGLLAATLQATAHAIAKSAMFVAVANVEEAEGSDDLDVLRGVGRRMPWSGGAFGAGALTLAGLPPTIGFVSEWFILEALMQQFRVPGLALRLGLVAAAAMVALTAGLGALVFLRVLALTMLGRSTIAAPTHRETGLFNKMGLATLGVACLALAALTPLEIRFIADGISPLVPRAVVMRALKSPWVLQPVFRGFSILSPSWLWVVLPTAAVAVFLATLVLSRGRFLRIRRVPSWHSATSGVQGLRSYTAFGFANPLRHVLANILGTKRTVSLEEGASDVATAGHSGRLETHTIIVEPVETYLYRPLRRGAVSVARVAKRMQSGRLNAYVAYMLIALLAALALVSAIH